MIKGKIPLAVHQVFFFMTDVQSSFVCHKKEKVQDYAEEPILQLLPRKTGGRGGGRDGTLNLSICV